MRREVRSILVGLVVSVIVTLLVALPALAAGPCCKAPEFAGGCWKDLDIESAAAYLNMTEEELSTALWAGGTLPDMASTAGADLQVIHDRVDAQRYRAIHGDVDYDGCCGCGSGCGDCTCSEPCDTCSGSCDTCDGSCEGDCCRRVTAWGLHLRTGPGTSYAIGAMAAYGTRIQVTGNEELCGGYRWAEVCYGGKLYWAASVYLAAA